jgi:Ser/Thr protein kinase RdoA (MazF antagonist)
MFTKHFDELLLLKEYVNKHFKGNAKIINTPLSTSNSVFEVETNDEKYIIKFESFYHPTGLTRMNELVLQSITSLSERINKSSQIINTIEIKSSSIGNGGVIMLSPKIYGQKFQATSLEDLVKLGNAVGEFHRIGAQGELSGLTRLPWEYYTPELTHAYKQHNRWDEIEVFLKSYNSPDIELVLNHNDLYQKNLLAVGGKIVFLDLNSICLGPIANDLGSILANFWLINQPKINPVQQAEAILNGYKTIHTECTLEYAEVIRYALRRLYKIEGYYLFKNDLTNPIIATVREQQRMLKMILGI